MKNIKNKNKTENRLNFRLNERQKEIIKMVGAGIAAGTVITIAVLFPNILGAVSKISDQIEDLRDAAAKYRLKLTVKRLVKKGVLSLSAEEIKLTRKGREILKLLSLDEIVIKRSPKWDGIWHLVSYDIPETKKRERDWFRLRLIHLGFRQIQDSLWVYPYECKEEIAIITQTLGISRYVIYLNTNHLPQEDKLLKRFSFQIKK